MEGVYNSNAMISLRINQSTEMRNIIAATSTTMPSSLLPEPVVQIHNVSSERRFPSRCLLDENNNLSEEAREKYLKMCVPLYKAALKGDWEAAKAIIDKDKTLLTTSISIGWYTVLHLAAGTDNVHFVEQLVAMMSDRDVELRDEKGNTALCFAAATGVVEVAKIMIAKNPSLALMRGGQGMTPLYMAAMFGKSEMAWYLYDKVDQSCNDEDRRVIFFSCIDTGIYDLALRMATCNDELATARNKDNKTALHLLAQTPEAFIDRSSEGWRKLIKSCYKSYQSKKNTKRTQALLLVKCLWDKVLIRGHANAMEVIRTPELLFDAAKMGNFDFLSELLNSYPDLIWEHDSQNQTIIHYAVMYRHHNIYNVIHDIGPIKEIIATYENNKTNNNLLHLAAKLPPPDRLNTVSGPALQMQQELFWFKEVQSTVQPLYVKKKNKKKEVPEQLFSLEHKKLLSEGEEWMKSTASSSMIVAALITTVVFTAIFTLPGGIKERTDTPNDINKMSFLIFVLSDGLALISSVVSIMMFLSILTSRYAESDFYKSLPLKLMIGLASLFFSVMTMVVAFCATIAIACHSGLKWVPFFISIIAFVPVALFVLLQFPLLSDTFSSTYWSRTVFQPNKRMLY